MVVLQSILTLQYDKVLFILELSAQAKTAIGKRVTVFNYPDGRLSIRLSCSMERGGARSVDEPLDYITLYGRCAAHSEVFDVPNHS
jgi:hypothetical protein